MNEQLWWHVARAGGIVSWALLALAVAWGLLLSTKTLGARPGPAWLLDLHRFLGGLALVFTGVHLAGLVADSYVHFGPADLLVPFASDWKPGAVAWGIVAFYVLLAVEVTSLFMRRIPRRVWKAVHASSFVLFVAASLHGSTAGTDARNLVYVEVSIVLTIAVLFLTLVRVLLGGKKRRALQRSRGERRRVQAMEPEPAPPAEEGRGGADDNLEDPMQRRLRELRERRAGAQRNGRAVTRPASVRHH
jgi:DMSO/TMAO reductase YedYZ heme-binding membrane subunit